MQAPAPLAIAQLQGSPGGSPPASSPPAYGRRGRGRGGYRSRVQLSPPSPNSCVVLKNLDYKITQDELLEVVRKITGDRKAFESVSLVSDKATGSFRGLAFVNFHTVDDASCALDSLSKICINGRKVVAEYRRLRPGEKAERTHHRQRVAPPRATFEQSVTDVDANGNHIDKRRAFFFTRDSARKADENVRAAEKAVRDREREAAFRARLLEYRDTVVDDKDKIVDLVFESDLTSYERRMVHVICDEIGLGHMSVLGDDGLRVLKVTKHPVRMVQWAELTADIRAAANERKGSADAEEKRRRNDAKREAARLGTSPNGHGQTAGERKKNGADNGTHAGPVTKEELEGIKWFKPRSAKAAAGEEVNASNAIKLPQYKLYIPQRQPSGPDGTIGFHRRKRAVDENDSGEGEENDEAIDGVSSKEDSTDQSSSPSDSGDGPEKATVAKRPISGNAKNEERIKSGAGSQTPLNPSVPAFTPSATYAT